MRKYKFFLTIFFSIITVVFHSCSSSDIPENSRNSEILICAKEEQNNKMYSKESDTTEVYWLNYKYFVVAPNQTKCNIFALNVIFRAGFKCPDAYLLAKDLFNSEKYNEAIPVIPIRNLFEINTGDIIIWINHVIIFEKLININGKDYAMAYWAGTHKTDDNINIKNNVINGKYLLEGNFIVRRPQKR